MAVLHLFFQIDFGPNVSKKTKHRITHVLYPHDIFKPCFFNPCAIQFVFTQNHVENGYDPHGFWTLGMATINENKKSKHRISYVVHPNKIC